MEVVREQQTEFPTPDLRCQQDLYGALLFLSGEHQGIEVREYIETQEKTHLAEGLEMQQVTIRNLPYKDGHVRGFGSVSMVDINTQGYEVAEEDYLTGDNDSFCLVARRKHDIEIAKRSDKLMAEGKIGDTLLVASPYEEEKDTETAKRLGFWPEFRRSYIWLYRKKNATELECVDISIDQSSKATYKEFLKHFGVTIPDDTESHDYPTYIAEINGIIFATQRDALIQEVKQTYHTLNLPDLPLAHEASDAFESTSFLEQHAKQYLGLLVEVHQAIARSLESGTLDDLVRLSASRALRTLNCLDAEQVLQLRELLAAEQLNNYHVEALANVIKAQRYGIWETVSQIATGQTKDYKPNESLMSPLAYSLHTARLLDQIYDNTNQAAAQHKTMPGCAGGLSFLEQNESDVKASIFNGESYAFDKKMHCVVCQKDAKKEEPKKMCGPCGICKPCDAKLKLKTAKAA